MNRFVIHALCLATLATAAACGQAPPGDSSPSVDSLPGTALLQASFTGVGDPASGRLQIFTGPQAATGRISQAAIGQIPEDANGDPATASLGTAQVYGAVVGFMATGAPGYPAACTAPLVMTADVDVLSGFTEQLRNVYARITSKSSGPTFCTIAAPGAVAPPGAPYLGLYAYQPLNAGLAPSAINRSVQWSMNLLDNSAFWFSGDLWAEVIPQLPTISSPADGATLAFGAATAGRVRFRWTNDPRADGSNLGENYLVARPLVRGALLTIVQCGPSTGAYDPASCTGTTWGPTQYTSTRNQTLPKGYWYRWTLRTVFSLPGQGTATTTGTLLSTRSFRTVT